jgi:hypothetical protein
MTPLVLTLKDNVLVNAPLEFIKAQKLMEVEKLSKTMTKIHAQVAEKAMSDVKAAIPKHSDKDAHAFAKLPSGQLRSCRTKPQERYVRVAGEVEGPAPHHECGVRLYVCRGKSSHNGAEGRARTRLQFHQEKEHNITAELAQAAEHNDHELFISSKILGARYNEQDMFHEWLVVWRGFQVGEVTWEPYSVMAVVVPEVGTKFIKSDNDPDMVSEMRSL